MSAQQPHGEALVCGRPFCDPCDADLHEVPADLQVVVNESGSACPHCQTSGFAAEHRMDERPVHFLVLWHVDTCPTLVHGGYMIANLPQTALKTGDAIFGALSRITEEDIGGSDAGIPWSEMQARLRQGERWPPHMVERARKITEREARQAQRAETEEW